MHVQLRLTALARSVTRLKPAGVVKPATLAPRLDALAVEVEDISDMVTQVFFSHIVPQVN